MTALTDLQLLAKKTPHLWDLETIKVSYQTESFTCMIFETAIKNCVDLKYFLVTTITTHWYSAVYVAGITYHNAGDVANNM